MSKLTIFEGPDGSGKTTAAKTYAKVTGAVYVHFGPMPGVGKSLGRMYVEAMLPALLGYQDVVMDRCWLSEVPYGKAFRRGVDRLGNAQRRMLERLAMRCETKVIRCDPGWEAVLKCFQARRGSEYLPQEHMLRVVYDEYKTQETALPRFVYDYTRAPRIIDVVDFALGTKPHRLGVLSAGNLSARVLLVGEGFAEHKDNDPLYQWPFGSFSAKGCSQWLTEQLDEAGISEADLMWVNADQEFSRLHDYINVIALGVTASQALSTKGIDHQTVVHPQFHKRFKKNEPYPLIPLLKEILK